MRFQIRGKRAASPYYSPETAEEPKRRKTDLAEFPSTAVSEESQI